MNYCCGAVNMASRSRVLCCGYSAGAVMPLCQQLKIVNDLQSPSVNQ